MEDKGIYPTFIRIMKSKRKGTVAVRINIKINDLKSPRAGFLAEKCVRKRMALQGIMEKMVS